MQDSSTHRNQLSSADNLLKMLPWWNKNISLRIHSNGTGITIYGKLILIIIPREYIVPWKKSFNDLPQSIFILTHFIINWTKHLLQHLSCTIVVAEIDIVRRNQLRAHTSIICRWLIVWYQWEEIKLIMYLTNPCSAAISFFNSIWSSSINWL